MSEAKDKHVTGDTAILLRVEVSVDVDKYVDKFGLQEQFSVMKPDAVQAVALMLAQADVLAYTKKNQFLTIDDINESFADRGVSVVMPERKLEDER